jgi:hypothetical protein
MNLLLSQEFSEGRFRKVLVFRARANGTGPLPLKWHGTIESLAVRSQAAFFASEPSARTVFWEGSGRKFRIDRIV